MNRGSDTSLSRRKLLAAGGALAGLSLLPEMPARAQAPAKWRRYNVASQQGQVMLGYYQKAIAAMLKLPPTDPRNWYRLAFTHYLDCPHGNWWLLPWHRAFTGWAEQIVRQMSGYPAFTFPYWDWTANPQVPAGFYQGLLSPNAPNFIGNLQAFAQAFQGPLAASGYWTPTTILPSQLQQLQKRAIGSNAVLWDQITNPQNPDYPSFFAPPNTRNPVGTLDCNTAPAVSAATIKAALASQDFLTFGSKQAPYHSKMVGFGILEGQPHNLVHNNTGGVTYAVQSGKCAFSAETGGFMQAFLSPVDPLFYLHHSNIDRLWDAWTRKQMALGLPYLPPAGPLYDQWANEPFLFFSDASGQPVKQRKAGDYAAIGAFSYDYQPGSVGVSPSLLAARRRPPAVRRFQGVVPPRTGGLLGAPGSGTTAIRIVPGLLQLARPGGAGEPIAKVTLALPHHRRGQSFRILADPGGGADPVEVGRVALFGHVMTDEPLTFTLPLGGALATLSRQGRLRTGSHLVFRAFGPGSVHEGAALTSAAESEVPIASVVVEAH